MPNAETRLRELLAFHGCNIGEWPEDAKPFGIQALNTPALAWVFEQERHFEALLKTRTVPMRAPMGLANRIIEASFARMPARSHWIHEALSNVGGAALVAMLVIGFAIGFAILSSPPQHWDAKYVQAFADEGSIL